MIPVRVMLASSMARASPKSVSMTFSTLISSRILAGFHIAMNQSLSMSGREPVGGLHADAQNIDQFQRADSIQPLLQRFARHIRHNDKRQLTAGMNRQNRHHVWMQNRGRRLSFSGESFASRRADGQLRSQHFHRNQSFQFRLIPLEHHAHAAVANHVLNLNISESADVLRRSGRFETLDGEVCGGVGVRRLSQTQCPIVRLPPIRRLPSTWFPRESTRRGRPASFSSSR